MRIALLLIALVPLTLVGCKSKKKGSDDSGGASNAGPTNAGTGSGVQPPPSGGSGSSGNPGGIVATPAAGGGIVTNPAGAVGGGGGGGGASGAVRKAAKRAASQNEIKQLHLYMFQAADPVSGRPPSPMETWQMLQRDQSMRNITAAIQEGVIVLAPPETGIWAYGATALEEGGMVATASGPERMDAQTLRNRLGGR